jgi:hypothetical protein
LGISINRVWKIQNIQVLEFVLVVQKIDEVTVPGQIAMECPELKLTAIQNPRVG